MLRHNWRMLHHLDEYPMMLSRYEICEELACNDSFRLCHGRCQEDGSAVLLKMPRHAPPSPFEVRLLAQEYAILQGLSLAGVLGVSALLRSDQGWCLVLEDRGGVPLPVQSTLSGACVGRRIPPAGGARPQRPAG
jgi:hypothetical protein